MRSITQTLNTNGTGYWSNEQREVAVTGMELDIAGREFKDPDDDDHGELRVYFDLKTWDPELHGLIYTDKLFLIELKDYLTRAGYDASDVGYSEQGMQGDDYVSLDAGQNFINTWRDR